MRPGSSFGTGMAMAALFLLQAGGESFAQARKAVACIEYKDQKKHAGRMLEFDGCYFGSGSHGAFVLQKGCADTLPAYLSERVTGAMNRAVGMRADAYPFAGDVSGRFKGIFRQHMPSSNSFFKDDGVALEVLEVAGARDGRKLCQLPQNPKRR